MAHLLHGQEGTAHRVPNKNCFMPANILLSETILTWGGEITDAIDGTFMEVDFVRVYKRRK